MTRLAVWVAIGVLALAACGGEDDDGEASPSEESQWANNVCQAADTVSSNISGLTDAIQVDPDSGTDALDQAQTEMTNRVDKVQKSISNLTDVITEVPDDTSDAITSAEDDLTSDAQQLNDSVGDLTGAVSKAADAGDAQEFTGALAEATSSLAATKDALSTLTDDIGSYLDSADDTVRQAFNDAAACQG